MTGGKVIHSNYRAVNNFCRYITYYIWHSRGVRTIYRVKCECARDFRGWRFDD